MVAGASLFGRVVSNSIALLSYHCCVMWVGVEKTGVGNSCILYGALYGAVPTPSTKNCGCKDASDDFAIKAIKYPNLTIEF